MNIKKLFGKKVKEKRLSLGLTQEELAEKADISAKSLSRIEIGSNFISAEKLEEVCTALNAAPKDLFDFYEDIREEQMLKTINFKITNNKNLLHKIYKILPIIE